MQKGSYIEVLHRLHKATGAAGCIWRRIIKLESLEISEKCQRVGQGTFHRETDFEAALPPLLVDILLTACTRWLSILDPTTASIIARCSKLS